MTPQGQQELKADTSGSPPEPDQPHPCGLLQASSHFQCRREARHEWTNSSLVNKSVYLPPTDSLGLSFVITISSIKEESALKHLSQTFPTDLHPLSSVVP